MIRQDKPVFRARMIVAKYGSAAVGVECARRLMVLGWMRLLGNSGFPCPSERRQLCALLGYLRGLGLHRIRLVGQLEPLRCKLLYELVDLAHQRFLGPSHLLSNPMVRLGQSYRPRPFLLDLPNRMKRADQHASVFIIPRYGQKDKAEAFPRKARRCWKDSLSIYTIYFVYIVTRSSRSRSASVWEHGMRYKRVSTLLCETQIGNAYVYTNVCNSLQPIYLVA